MRKITHISELKVGDWLNSGGHVTKIVSYYNGVYMERFEDGGEDICFLVNNDCSYIMSEEEISLYLLSL